MEWLFHTKAGSFTCILTRKGCFLPRQTVLLVYWHKKAVSYRGRLFYLRIDMKRLFLTTAISSLYASRKQSFHVSCLMFHVISCFIPLKLNLLLGMHKTLPEFQVGWPVYNSLCYLYGLPPGLYGVCQTVMVSTGPTPNDPCQKPLRLLEGFLLLCSVHFWPDPDQDSRWSSWQ